MISKMNLTGLRDYLNEKFQKKNGKKFTVGDVQGYISRGRLPVYLSALQISEVTDVRGIKIYKLEKHKENAEK